MAVVELAPGALIAGYRVEELVGRGGMGVVYRATQLSLERSVALKLISPELASEERFRDRFLREARLAASIDHPHFLPVHEAGEAEGALFVAMRLVEGASLAERLRVEGAFAPDRALRLLSQLGSALGAAHEAGLLHRDVKPGNVLLAGSGDTEYAYLCDFGLARRLAGGSLTREGGFVGTVAYAAPEQIRGAEVDERADLYSLACLFYECLLGAPPFSAEDELALCWAHMHEPPASLGEADPALAGFDSFFARALAKDPADRFSSAAALVEAAQTPLVSVTTVLNGPRRLELPVPATPLIGRERELQEVEELLRSSRLLTLTGAGGSGKTRLAIAAAARVADEFLDGVVFVSLAALADPELVEGTIASTLGAKRELVEFLAPKHVLLVLDNLEQLLPEAAPLIGALLSAPQLKVLATSRERLALSAEQEYPVPTLPLDEAVALFTQRARQLKPSFEPDEHVREIARRLDGLPLALELAAARIKVMTTRQILGRLEHNLDLLASSARDLPERQRTLRATIAWSHQLLNEEERRLFSRLAVFPGSFTLEAAESICDAELQPLESLVDKSLLRQTQEGRFFMLQTILEFALETFHATDDRKDLQERHAAYFAQVAADLGGSFSSGDQDAALARFEAEEHDLRRALEFFVRSGDERALSMVGGLTLYWLAFGRLEEGAHWSESALEATRDAAPLLVAEVISDLGEFARFRGDSKRAVALKHQALDRLREIGEPTYIATCLHDLADIQAHEGDYASARELATEALEIRRQLGSPSGIAHAMSTLADVALFEGDFATAQETYEEILKLWEEDSGGDVERVNFLFLLGETLRRQGSFEQAAGWLRKSLVLAARLKVRYVVPDVLYAVAALNAEADPRGASVLVGAAEAMRAETGFDAFDTSECARITASLSERLGGPEFARAQHAGAAMAPEAALRAALDALG